MQLITPVVQILYDLLVICKNSTCRHTLRKSINSTGTPSSLSGGLFRVIKTARPKNRWKRTLQKYGKVKDDMESNEEGSRSHFVVMYCQQHIFFEELKVKKKKTLTAAHKITR